MKAVDLVFEKKIGKGNFGEVWKGTYKHLDVAIKKLYFVDDELMQTYIEREMVTLRCVQRSSLINPFAFLFSSLLSSPHPPLLCESRRRQSKIPQRPSSKLTCFFRGVHHPNIVQLVGICDDEKENVFIVTEFVDGGNLNQLLQSYKLQKMNMAWSQRLKIALATAKAMRYLHDKKNIMHRDLKSDNILVFSPPLCAFSVDRLHSFAIDRERWDNQVV